MRKNKKTQEQFEKEVSEKQPNLVVIGKYINNNTKILLRCNVCGLEWETLPRSITSSGVGCKRCSANKAASRIRKSKDTLIAEMQLINPSIEIIGEYKNNRTKIKCRCHICGHEWSPTADAILHGSGCPSCRITKQVIRSTKTTQQFRKDLLEIKPSIEVVGEYTHSGEKIELRCKVCGYEWSRTPHALISTDSKCPKCSGKTRRTTEDFKNELAKINPNVIVLGEYTRARDKLKCKCKVCGHEWCSAPYSLLIGFGCAVCKESHGEKKISKILKTHSINYKREFKFDNCRLKRALPFDFYLPSKNVCIEYDGVQHFKANEFFGGEEGFKRTQYRDSIKNNYCKENGIKLIRIPYTTKNIEALLASENII